MPPCVIILHYPLRSGVVSPAADQHWEWSERAPCRRPADHAEWRPGTRLTLLQLISISWSSAPPLSSLLWSPSSPPRAWVDQRGCVSLISRDLVLKIRCPSSAVWEALRVAAPPSWGLPSFLLASAMDGLGSGSGWLEGEDGGGCGWGSVLGGDGVGARVRG